MGLRRRRVVALLAVATCVPGCRKPPPSAPVPASRPAATVPSIPTPTTPQVMISPIVTAARRQVGRTTIYDGSYVRLPYPGGDVPLLRGVCTDVVVRALRDGMSMDLQRLVHEDMRASFAAYPNRWGLRRPDANIDHRRVPNLRRYFERQGWSVGVSRNAADYRPGDLVTCTVGGRPHIMIVSDRKTPSGVPLVIHNIGRGAAEEEGLFAYPLTGHYRMPSEMQRFPADPASRPRQA